MTSDRFVGPFILRDAERYFTILQDEIWPVICTWVNIEEMIFMQDGALPHFAIIVRENIEQ